MAKIEQQLQRARDHIRGTGPGMNVRALPRRRRKIRVAAIPFGGGELRERRRDEMNRIAAEMRIGDVPLHALDDQRSRQRAAPAVLDHVAQDVDRRWLADDAIVESLAARGHLLDDFHRAVDGRTFLVGRDEKRDGARCVRMRRGPRSLFDGRDERRERTSCPPRRGRTESRLRAASA
jgi:hypothetical protein